ARKGGLFRTTGFRLAALGAALACVTAAIVFALIYYSTLGTMRAALDAEIRGEAAEILPPGAEPGPQALLASVRAALAEPHSGIFYAVQARSGAMLAGNLATAPLRPGWHSLVRFRTMPRAPHVRMIRGLAIETAGGILFVGENATALRELNELMRRSFAIGFGVTLLTGLAAGLAFGRRALARVDAVSATSREIMAGDLTRRLTLAGTGDEFDQLAEVINAMLARIEWLMENIRQVGNELAHDLRSPLGRLRETLELALRERDVAAAHAAIGEAIEQVDDSLALFAAILRLARIESGARRASFVKVGLSALLESLAETYETVAEEFGRRLSAAIAPDLSVQGDAALITQLFANLIENAIRHCPEGAAISLAARGGPEVVLVSVSDDGPGIPAAQHALVLRRFGRLDESRHTGGHGLGLPLAAAIADLHAASLTLSNARPRADAPGLSVTVAFPKEESYGRG
ncbi:MAG TPA: HAMP domain-containing sensor histidine kinase, partial [Acetobacteraceae bacterium]|nr:HAMP domain-containing sensor histidine kinase [Acetobacteraceae bacterium]